MQESSSGAIGVELQVGANEMMTQSLLPAGALPCLWMSAGVVSYRLCDRAYDCEGCPLDAALRGARGPATRTRSGASPGALTGFPDDRRYTRGHLWLGAAGDGTARLGLDAFAAHLLPAPSAVRWPQLPREVAPGEAVCELVIDGEGLPLTAPIAGHLLAGNPLLTSRPGLALADPYGAGWLVELSCDTAGDVGLDAAPEAEERARLDLALFRRRVALHLLADSAGLGPTLADGGAPLTDLKQIVGRQVLASLLRELVH